MMSSIVGGSEFQFDLVDLAVIGKAPDAIILNYKQGLKVRIEISAGKQEIERQYKEICDAQLQYNKERMKP